MRTLDQASHSNVHQPKTTRHTVMWSPLYYIVGIENTKSESFNYVDRFIECRNAGLASLIELDSTDPENQMAQIGNHLKSTIQENFLSDL